MKYIVTFLLWFALSVPGTTVLAQDIEVTAGESISPTLTEQIDVSTEILEGRIIEVTEEVTEQYDESQSIVFQTVLAEITRGSLEGETIQIEYNRTLSQGQSKLVEGDQVLINYSSDSNGQDLFYVIDYVRQRSLMRLFLLFALVVLLVGQWKGVSALAGLASSFVIIFAVILPGLQQGLDPLAVTIFGASLIIGITFYLSHGFNEKTSWAVLGTIISLVLVGGLAAAFTRDARLTGFGAEEAAFLQMLKSGNLNVRGLYLAGIIIGALGVLDDITISQASIVKELKDSNPKLSSSALFLKAMNVGRDHIASLVNTLILVYTGASLPLLLLFDLDSSRTAIDVINYEMVAEEIVHTLVGSIGLVIAVPITTALVAWFGFQKKKTT